MSYIPKIGDKVFLRSNEPTDKLIVGTVERLETWGKFSSPIIYVKDEKTRHTFAGGVVRPYDINTHADLEMLRPIEQWNYLVQGTGAFNQIPEKYGVKYKTFK